MICLDRRVVLHWKHSIIIGLTKVAFQGNKPLKKAYSVTMYLTTRFTFTEKVTSVAQVREQTKPIERPPLVGEVSANFCR
jgi:hypothetical protein